MYVHVMYLLTEYVDVLYRPLQKFNIPCYKVLRVELTISLPHGAT